MKSQFLRGGGSMCFQAKNLWNVFRAAINDVEGCPLANKVSSFRPLEWLASLPGRAWKKIEEKHLKCGRKKSTKK